MRPALWCRALLVSVLLHRCVHFYHAALLHAVAVLLHPFYHAAIVAVLLHRLPPLLSCCSATCSSSATAPFLSYYYSSSATAPIASIAIMLLC
ncbi:hypothetical protein PF008_g12022 [Phytophthora fragariae]|uniref:Uncharacterized protein n=1 Tax=Phytophthora fragariae TaxID=53985 RepID=A0A6G0RP66_9STRA|nr:hypothetical protein PF008_g12022 [Phytophthora fragariae]